MCSGRWEAAIGVDESVLTDAELAETVLELDMIRSQAEAAMLRVTGVFADRGVWARDGAVSARAWMVERCDLKGAEVSAVLKYARLSAAFPATGSAAGTLGVAKVRVMLGAINRRTRAFYERDEHLLLGWAAAMTVEEVIRMMVEWLIRIDQEGPPPHDPKRNEVTLVSTYEGWWRLHGELDPETGAALRAALEERADKIFRAQRDCPEPDQFTPTERTGEALALLTRDAQTNAAAAGDETVAPAFTAIIDLDTLEGRVGRRCEIPGFGPIRGDTARRLLCESRVNRLITDAASAILDAGRTTYTPNRAQRRALVARDGGCGWPGCDMPPGWCDAHHIIFWGTQQGPTDIDLLILLCRRHHRMVHEGKWRIERINGVAVVHDPNGQPLKPPVRSIDPQRRHPHRHRERQPTPT